MTQDGIPFIPKSSLHRQKSGQHFDEARNTFPSNQSQHPLNKATGTFPPDFPQQSLNKAAKPSSDTSQQEVDAPNTIHEAMEEIWTCNEFKSTQRAAAGAVLPDAQDQAKTLSNLKEWDAAVTLSTAMTTGTATFQERYWEKQVRSLETMGHAWKSKWAGIQYWDEKRVPYLDGTMGVVEAQEYLSHVQFG
jgi:hypothetical protein